MTSVTHSASGPLLPPFSRVIDFSLRPTKSSVSQLRNDISHLELRLLLLLT